MNRNGETLKEFLGLDKQRIRRLSDLNGSGYMVAALQEERRTGKRISDGNLERIECEHIEVTNLHGEKIGMSIEQEMNFLQRQQERNGWGIYGSAAILRGLSPDGRREGDGPDG